VLSSGTYCLTLGTDAGVYGLRRGQTTWASIAAGLPSGTRIEALAYDPDSALLYAGGLGGVFVTQIPR
jgi:propanediol dehydratase large subunit